jgi:hypothetical protein
MKVNTSFCNKFNFLLIYFLNIWIKPFITEINDMSINNSFYNAIKKDPQYGYQRKIEDEYAIKCLKASVLLGDQRLD